jgi:ferrous iron transport protein B
MEAAAPAVAEEILLLVGNPNVGKSALFAHLTGRYVTVSNYPGTTVDVTRGRYRRGRLPCQVVDTPGVYSLVPQSEDEIVTRDLLLTHPGARVVLVLDAKNLQRGLVLAQQLGELGHSYCIALNMMDDARSLGFRIDPEAMSEVCGVPVVPTVATSGRGVANLAEAIATARPGRLHGIFPAEINEPAERIAEILARVTPESTATSFLAVSILADPHSVPDLLDRSLTPELRRKVEKIALKARRAHSVPLQALIYQARLAGLARVLARIVKPPERETGSFATWLGRIALHPVWGLGLAAIILFLIYEFVGVLGAGTLVDWFEGSLFAGHINPWAIGLAQRWLPWAVVRDFLVGEYGLVTMALTYSFGIILPVVGTFFIAFGILEDSGYMPRLAVMADRFLRRMGLHGKAVLPMVLGLGCDTMATLTARILETRKERVLVTLLLALGVPCSAQLGVILGMMGAVSFWGTLIWFVVVTGVLFATGAIAARILPGASSDFILELPPLRVPGLKNILIKTAARIEWYLKEAVPLFILGTLLLFLLDRLDLLGTIRGAMAPVVSRFMGLPSEAADAFLIGFLRRDYGAAGLFEIQRQGLLNGRQIVVSLVIITLYVPCVANFFVMIKERGLRAALAILGVILVIAVSVGGALNGLLQLLEVQL